MNTKIDVKSALIGLLLGVLVTVAIAAASSPSQAGRYQVAGTGSYGLVLDTVTGQVWSMFFSSSGGQDGWRYILSTESRASEVTPLKPNRQRIGPWTGFAVLRLDSVGVAE